MSYFGKPALQHHTDGKHSRILPADWSNDADGVGGLAPKTDASRTPTQNDTQKTSLWTIGSSAKPRSNGVRTLS